MILSTPRTLRTKHVPCKVHLSQWSWKYLWPASRRFLRITHREVQLVGSRVSQFEEFLTNSKHIIRFSRVTTAILHKGIKGQLCSVYKSIIPWKVLYSVRTASEAPAAYYPKGSRGSVPENKASEAWIWPSVPPPSAKFKNRGAIPPFPFTPSCRGA